MTSIFHAVILSAGFLSASVALAQNCGSGGGATVCLSANGTSNSVDLSWTVSGNLSTVEVYRDTDSDPNGRQRIAVPAVSARTYSDTSAVTGTQYWYWVKFFAAGTGYNSGAASAKRIAACPTPSVVPYLKVGSTWSQTGVATVAAGAPVALGPQPIAGGNWANGSWNWSGCGTSGGSREQNISPAASCVATAVFTDTCGQQARYDFKISSTASWKSLKIGGGGYVPGLIFHPTTPNLLYARTDIGGAYRWDPVNSTWIAITDIFGARDGFHHGSETMAVDPNNDNKVYMSTGMYLNGGNARMYMSSDRGNNWTYVDLPFAAGSNNQGRAIGERLMVDPNLSSTLFYGTRMAGLWKSIDSGVHWAQVSSLSSSFMSDSQRDSFGGSPAGVELVVFDTNTKGTGAATQTIYAAIAPDYVSTAGLSSSLYKSTNGGSSWQPVTTPLWGFHIPHMVRAADGMFYVAFTKEAGPGAGGPAWLYKFDGSTWTLLRSEATQQWVNYGYGGLSVSGTGATTRIALGITNSWGNWDGIPVVAMSDNAGTTWREISGNKPHNPAGGVSGWIDDVEIDPLNRDHILHVHGGGVWETKNASDANPSWTEMISGIEETANVSMIAPPAGASYLLLNSSLDVGMLVHTALDAAPALGPRGDLALGSGFSADMAWSNPSYIVALGAASGGDSAASAGKAASFSTNSGVTWSAFPTVPPTGFNPSTGKLINQAGESNIAVTAPNNVVWAQGNSIPYYTTNNGASWVRTNLPDISGFSVNRAYHLAADRKNPMKVYAYESGGAWWGTNGKFYYSTDGGHTFTQSTNSVIASLHHNMTYQTSMVVNPNAEGDVWIADGENLYHSTDSGQNWVKLTTMSSVWGTNDPNQTPQLFGASYVTLGKAAPNSSYSAAVYMVGTINSVWGLYRSDDAGASWTRINDDNHQFGGIGQIAADNNIYGRVYISGGGRGLLYNF